MMRNHSAKSALLAAALLLQNTPLAFADSSGGPYTLSKQSIAGGGGTVLAAPNFSAVVTLGQATAGTAAAGSFQLTGGFHQAPDATGIDVLFSNGFEN